MLIHILYTFTSEPFGGANQFLRALKKIWQEKGVYTEEVGKADIILFNSHSHGADGKEVLSEVVYLKYKFPQKIFLHRISGPIDAYRGFDSGTDAIIYKVNQLAADGTIFQSAWSQKANHEEGMKVQANETVIPNAPDPKIFNKDNHSSFSQDRKVRLIATSWSDNKNKGFDIYQFLDTHLDFSRFEMTFIGKSPVEFKHILKLPPQTSTEIAEQLKKHDIFISASRRESFSNAIAEALHSGLPVIAYNESSNPEVVGKGGELFSTTQELIPKIEQIAQNYTFYQSQITVPFLKDIANSYYAFAGQILNVYSSNSALRKTISFLSVVTLLLAIFKWKLKGRWQNIKRRF